MSTTAEKEDGEISLEDVSSSDDGQSNDRVSWSHSMTAPSPTRRSHSLREVAIPTKDAGHGKENRHYTREINSRYPPNPASKADDLVPISSDDEHEIVELPDASHHFYIHLGKKKHKKRKKKKASSGSEIVMEDYVSGTAPEPLVLNTPKPPTEITVCRRRRSPPTPRATRRYSPFTRRRAISRSPSDTSARVYRVAFRGRSPSPRTYLSRSPSPRRRSPRKTRPPRDQSPKRAPVSSRSKSPRNISPRNISPRNISPVSRTKAPRKACYCRPPTTYADLYATSLLKKVRRLENVGTLTPDGKSKDHSSLKDKLNNILNTKSAKNHPHPAQSRKQRLVCQSVSEEDDNLDVLRRLALETKPTKLDISEPDHLSDNDPEDLELRMIALKSAVIKKHQKRVNDGKRKRDNAREMSPLAESVLIDLGDHSSPLERSLDDQQIEDMELDTDVEREKEERYSPYSPSDEIMRHSPGIDQYPNALTDSEVKSNISMKTEDERDSVDGVNMEAPYSPTDPTKTPWVDRFKKERRKTVPRTIIISSDSESSEAAPYSPTDTPVYDPELRYCPPDTLDPLNDDNCVVLDLSMKDPQEPQTHEKSQKNNEATEKPPVVLSLEAVTPTTSDDDNAPLLFRNHNSPPPQPQEIQSKDGNELTYRPPEPPSPSQRLYPLTLLMPPTSVEGIAQVTGEPLYLRGLPEVTKQPNKIPILVNKSLVPVSILKTNKNLQQPLPYKKIDAASEPTFKSAEMLPVDVWTEPVVVTSTFKPIKLQPVAKKTTVAAPAAAFNNVSVDECVNEESEDAPSAASGKNDGNDDDHGDGDHEDDGNDDGMKNIDEEVPEVIKNNRKREKLKPGTKQKKCLNQVEPVEASADAAINPSVLHDQTNLEDLSRMSGSSLKSSDREEVDKISQSSDKEKENEANASVTQTSKEDLRRDNRTGQKKDDPSVDTVSADEVNEKKRRNSIEEDEETLRAILLASLAKRPKIDLAGRGSDMPPKASEGAAKIYFNSQEESPKTQAVDKTKDVDQGKNNNRLVNKIGKTSEIVDDSSKQLSQHPPVNVQRSKVIGAPKALDGAVEVRKRLNPSAIKGSPKKMMKKTAIPVSTKVVNNAKKFQNTMQRKLILQAQGKRPTSANSVSQNLKLVNLKTNEALRPVSPKMKVQSLVIKLGEDSDSDSGEDGEMKKLGGEGQRDVLSIPTTDFEKSVDQFLKEQRKKQETMAMSSATATSTPTPAAKGTIKTTARISGTPLAVRHLPPSQQEEYKRLKQKILEKERQRATRQKANTPPSPLSPASPIAKPTKFLPKPSTLPDTKTSIKHPTPSRPMTVLDENSLQQLPQTKLISTIKGTTPHSISSSPGSTQPMTNLSIQIPNDNITPGGRIVFDKPENASQVPSTLRILTTDQLNSKFVGGKVQLKQGGRTVILGIGDQNRSIGELLESNNVDSDGTKELTKAIDSPEENKTVDNDPLSSIVDETDKSRIDQTSQELSGGDGGSMTVDSEASTVIVAPREEDEDGETSRESGDSTIVLDDTVEERMPETPRSPSKVKSKSPTKEHSEKIKNDVKVELESLMVLNEEQQRERLKEIERNLVTKRFSVLDDLTEMSSTLKQWDLERELQANLFAELKRLRAQLALAEERLLAQKIKIDGIGPKVTNAHKMIVEGRAECLKLTKLCQGIGTKVVGQEYKVPGTGAQMMMERLKEVAYHTRQLSKKKVPCENNSNSEMVGSACDEQSDKGRTLCDDSDGSWDQNNGNGDNDNSRGEQSDNASGVVISRSTEETPSDPLIQIEPLSGDSGVTSSGEISRSLSPGETRVQESIVRLSQLANSYESVLTSVRTPRHIDCNRELCPFELTGVCKDDGCTYNHLEPRGEP